MYLRIYICIHICIYICKYVHMFIDTYIYVVYICVYIIYTYIYMHAYIYTCSFIYTYVYVYTYVHIYMSVGPRGHSGCIQCSQNTLRHFGGVPGAPYPFWIVTFNTMKNQPCILAILGRLLETLRGNAASNDP